MTVTLHRRQVLLLASCALPCMPAFAQMPALRALLDERLRHEGVGLAVARLHADAAPELAAAGRARDGDPLTADRHRLEIGSITKTFIGLLLADAVLRGDCKLDEPAEAQLGFALRDSAGAPLRLIDLATHRSGLPRLAPNMAPADPANPYADYGDEALLAALRAFQPSRRRDERFEYSNFGFGLLGWLLAQRAQQDLMPLLQARILQPLGLDAPLPDAQGHNAQGQPVPAWTFSKASAGAGALRLSAAQLARYAAAALRQDTHALADAYALALKPHSRLGPQPGVQTGLGWILAERDGERIATHDGGTFGFSSSLWLNLSQRRGGLALANAFVPVGDLARHLMDARSPLRDVAAERRATQQTELALAPEQLAPLAGVYALNPQFKLTLRVRDGRLFAQASGQGEFELFAKAERDFFAKVTALSIRFEAGQPSPALLLQQGGQQLRFVRD